MRIRYATIMVADLEESVRFYTEVLGFEVESRHDPRPGVRIVLLKGDGDALVELIRDENDPRQPGLYSVGMEVEDIHATVRELKAKGARITMEPTPITVGTLAFLEDPNGVRIALIEHH
ncbi:VOC family protein [Candidatus Solincola sp.]|nr:VOC family protein [Actinomycetota bacterium]MDI7251051.1 VOC family protein [Actinomycetota bacterium]